MSEFTVGALILGLVQCVVAAALHQAQNRSIERLKSDLEKQSLAFAEGLKWEQRKREQAVRAARYLALAQSLKEGDPREKFEEVNQLSWELAMWLPPEVYRAMTLAIAEPTAEGHNPHKAVIALRQVLLGESAGNLSDKDIAMHAPGIGRGQNAKKAPA